MRSTHVFAVTLGVGLLMASGARAEAPPDEERSGGASPPTATPHAGREGVTPAQPAEREHKLDFLYLKAETGAEYVGLQTLSLTRDLVPSTVRRDDTGVFGGAAAGVKLLFVGFGPHFRVAQFRDWDLWTLNLDVQWLAPLGKVEPYLMLSGGYARLGRAFDSIRGARSVRVTGYDVRLVLGGDYFVSQNVSLGASLSSEVLGMHRPGVDLNSQDGLINDLYKYDGASAGLGFTGGLGLGFHL
jgi:hypothetical protein